MEEQINPSTRWRSRMKAICIQIGEQRFHSHNGSLRLSGFASLLGFITLFFFGAVNTSILLMAQAGSPPVDQKPTQIGDKKAQVVVSHPAQLEELRDAIKRRGGKWVAGETSNSRLTHEATRRLF